MNRRKLIRWINAALDRELSPDNLRLLKQELHTNPESLRIFKTYQRLNIGLEHRAQLLEPIPIRPSLSWYYPAAGSSIAAVVLVGFFIYSGTPQPENSEVLAQTKTAVLAERKTVIHETLKNTLPEAVELAVSPDTISIEALSYQRPIPSRQTYGTLVSWHY
jgi:hypothetical protein